MVSGLEMVNDLNALSDALTQAIHDMAKHGKKYAECEKAYKVRLMQETLKLRDAGMPVTLIDKVVMGICAEERCQRDINEVFYKTAQENVNAIKLRMRVLDNQIGREWGNNERS